jgi:FMN-dependent NADH-azoreductase
MRVLHIVATPRADASNTMKVADAFFAELVEAAPECTIETLDLFADDLPKVAGANIEAKYTLMTGTPLNPVLAQSWTQIEALIERFLTADVHVMSVPMWNFSIPYTLKYFIDAVVQPGYLFRYNATGIPEGMVHGKKMVVITARGADYSAQSPFHAYDFMEPYLRAIFGFVGIYDMEFVYAQPTDMRQFREAAMARAFDDARAAARRLAAGKSEALTEEILDGLTSPVVLPIVDGPVA